MRPGGDRPTIPDDNILSRRPWYAIGIALALLSFLLRQPVLLIAGLLLAALGAVPELWYRFCLSNVVVRQRMSESRLMFGDQATLVLTIENRKVLPLPWLELVDELPLALELRGPRLQPSSKPGRAVLEMTMALWLYQRVTRRYMVRGVARGAFAFGPLLLRSGDPFGLLTREWRLDETEYLIVYPLVVPIERLGLPAHHPFGERTAPRRLLDDPLRVAGVRQYVAGDEPRRIHWKATARVGTPQSKVYEPATRHMLAIFVDTRTFDPAQMTHGYDPVLFELALTTAASTVSWGLAQRYAVGMFANGTLTSAGGVSLTRAAPSHAPNQLATTEAAGARARLDLALAEGAAALRLRVPPATAAAQLPRALDALARLSPYFGQPIETVIGAEQHELPFGTTVVYVGAAAALDLPGLAALEQLRRRGHSVTLLLTGDAPLETALPAHRVGGKETWDALVAEALDGDRSGHTLDFG